VPGVVPSFSSSALSESSQAPNPLLLLRATGAELENVIQLSKTRPPRKLECNCTSFKRGSINRMCKEFPKASSRNPEHASLSVWSGGTDSHMREVSSRRKS
jgi:hypothetical protein